MARVTVEDCLEKIPNRFALTVLASRRARALSEGKGTALVRSINKVGVVALREIAKDKVRYTEDVEGTIMSFIEEQRAQLMAGSPSDVTFIDAAAFGAGDDEDEDEDDDIKELSVDPDKLVEDEESEDEEEVEEEPAEEEEEAAVVDDEAVADEEVDPAVLEGLDEDLDEDDDEDEEEDEPLDVEEP